MDEKIQGNCTVENFHCKSGECIPTDSLCDGIKDCGDASDESVEFCASKCCPPFGFRYVSLQINISHFIANVLN